MNFFNGRIFFNDEFFLMMNFFFNDEFFYDEFFLTNFLMDFSDFLTNFNDEIFNEF